MTPSRAPIDDVPVELGERSYAVTITFDDGPGALARRVAALAPTGVVVVTDGTVERLHATPVLAALGRDVATVVVEPGEASKSIAQAERLWRSFHRANLDREGLVVALGGGVVGDLAGFAAATWLRGVRVLHAPTTLLSMVDSAVGGKTGLDLEGKNLVGAFHQPAGVVADVAWLSTLPARELRSGLGEAWKTAALSGEALFARLEACAREARAGDPEALLPIVAGCVAHKAGVVSRDEREQGERASLNLGHTLGHALEAQALAAGRDLPHGEAVAVGVAFACRLARRLDLLDEPTCARLLSLGGALGLPLRAPWPLDLPALRPHLARDKKGRRGRPRWILPTGLGAWVLREVDDATLEAALAASD